MRARPASRFPDCVFSRAPEPGSSRRSRRFAQPLDCPRAFFLEVALERLTICLALAAEAKFPRGSARMDRDGCPLVMGDGPGVPQRAGALANRLHRNLPTHGNSARGIHAFFGSDRPGGLRHADPRRFLRRTLGETAGEASRNCRNATALDDPTIWAWKQVIKPQAQNARWSV